MYLITEFEFFFTSRYRKNGFLYFRLKIVTTKMLINDGNHVQSSDF